MLLHISAAHSFLLMRSILLMDYGNLYIHSQVNSHQDFSQVFSIVNKVAMNIRIEIFV